MDSTMRSNATVGSPIDVLIYAKDSFRLNRRFSLEADDPCLLDIKAAWDEKLKQAFAELRRFNWSEPPPAAADE